LRFEELTELPIKVTQPTPHLYGEDTCGVSLSCKAVVGVEDIEFDEEPATADMWGGEQEVVTTIGKLLSRASYSYEVKDCEIEFSIATSNGDDLLHSKQGHKLTVTGAAPKPERKVEYSFVLSWYNEEGELDIAQQLMKREGLFLTTKTTYETEESEAA
jgi:hypothetical protein